MSFQISAQGGVDREMKQYIGKSFHFFLSLIGWRRYRRKGKGGIAGAAAMVDEGAQAIRILCFYPVFEEYGKFPAFTMEKMATFCGIGSCLDFQERRPCSMSADMSVFAKM